jgi:hypothetical protein
MTSHRRSQFRRSIAAGVAIAALAAPAVQAAPIQEGGTGDTPGSQEIDVSELKADADSGSPVTTVIDEGFDWGSAAIGAGAAGALLALVSLGGYKFASRNHTRVAH